MPPQRGMIASRGRFSKSPLLRVERVAAVQGLRLRGRNRRRGRPAGQHRVARMKFVHELSPQMRIDEMSRNEDDGIVLLWLSCP
jgi:hypothetical protein